MKKIRKNSTFPLVSIIIPVYNAAEFIERAVISVMKTDYPNFEIVLVDDMSTDKSWDILKKIVIKNNNIRIERNSKKLLAAGTRNVGCRMAKGEFIALLDHDVEVDKNWINEAISIFKLNKSLGTVQGVVMDVVRRDIIQHAGIMINAYLGWVIAKGFGKKIKNYKPKEEEVFANATGLIFKKEVWKKIGGFDEDLAINLDDWDFNWRCWLYGYKQILAPKSITYHWSKKQNVRDKWISRLPWEFHFAKVPWLFIKNYELVSVFKFLPIYLVASFIRGIFNLIFRFNPSPILAYFGALFWTAVNFDKLIIKRHEVQKNRQLKDSYLLNKIMDKNFVTGYFIKHWLPVITLGKAMSTNTPK